MLKYIIFDADHTLLEFDSDEKAAIKKTFGDFGLNGVTDEQLQYCRNISYEGWAEIGLNDVHLAEIQKNYHRLYREYIYVLMERLTKEFNVAAAGKEAGDRFIERLSEAGHVIGGSLDVLYRLAEYYKICVATNGLSSIQRGRLAPFDGIVYKCFISDELGHIKPEKEFFHDMLGELNATADECLMVGDSVSSDIVGAQSVGMKTCLFDRFGAGTKGTRPDYTIKELEELLPILL